MSIKNTVREFVEIETEIKRTRKHLQGLNEKKKKVEEEIITYLEETDQPGLKYNGMTFVPSERTVRKYKKKSERFTSAEDILENCGIQNSKKILEEILESMKGSPDNKQFIKKFD